jgi:proline iminopeptidase
MGRLFPCEWEPFAGTVPAAERGGDLAAAYARLLADPNPQARAQAARQWCAWEDTHMSLTPGWAPNLSHRDPEFQLTFARLVTHYWSQGCCILEEGEILAHMHRLADIPAVLIHGRYDVSGSLDTAWHLHRAWPNSKLIVLNDAGHGGGSYTSELVGALDSFRTLP